MEGFRKISCGWLLILSLLLVPCSGWTQAAVDELSLSFEQIEQVMRQRSPLLIANAASREVNTYLITKLDEAVKLNRHSLNSIADLNSYLFQLSHNMSSVDANASPDILALRASLDALISIVAGQLNSQLTQLTQVSRDYAQIGELAAANDSLHDADLQAIYGTHILYQRAMQATRHIELLQADLVLLRLQEDTASSQYELGLTTDLLTQQVRVEKEAKQVEIALAEINREACIAELNLQLGFAADATLLLQALPSVDPAALQAIVPQTAWQVVYKEAYTLKAKRHIVGALNAQHEDTKRLYGELGDRAWNSLQELQAAERALQLAGEQLTVSFNKAYQQMQLLIRKVELAEAGLEIATLALQQAEQKYAVGYISALELQIAENQRLQQEHIRLQANDELLLAYQRWLLFQKGMSIAD